jgi:hypothetical protein
LRFQAGSPKPAASAAALEWIKTAKTPETRAKRIPNETTSAAQTLRLSPFRR